MNKLLIGLNEKQIQAVTTNDIPLRIIAGAGSGKTKVITTKIAYLIDELKIAPWKILAVTFTNKTAREMNERVQKLIGEDNRYKPFISTFHSFCARVLREEFSYANLTKDFLIIDSADQQAVIKKIVKDLGYINENESISKTIRKFLSKISNWKNNFTNYQEAQEDSFSPDDSRAAIVYEKYEQELVKNNSVDFDDLQLKVTQIFNSNSDIVEKWRNRFDYVMVDEFQDTNEVQFDLIKYLTRDKNNLMVVGDPDQTIYSWRGAKVNIILNFSKTYPNSETVILNQNYRSTQQILNVANDFIAHNENREKKYIFTDNTSGKKVMLRETTTRYSEAKYVASEIKNLVENKKYDYNDIFVLYRINSWSQEFEKVLFNSKIPFQLVGGIRFRDRKVIKDAMALLKVIAVHDNLSMERILGFTPKVGQTSIEKIINLSEQKNKRIFDLLIEEDEDLLKITKNLTDLIQVLQKAKEMYENNFLIAELSKYLLVGTGYESKIKNTSKDEDEINNIYSFYDQLKKFDENFNPEDYDNQNRLNSFLQEEALDSEQEDIQPNKVTLLTVHSAKGLENKVVFVVGLNREVFPSKMSTFSIESFEEERRALYVALTRAKELLYITYVNGEYSYITKGELSPSKFVSELNSELYDFEKNIFVHSDGNITSEKIQPMSSPRTIKTENSIKIKKGDIVNHIIFGDGIVVKVIGNQLQIAFNNSSYGVMVLPIDNPALTKK